MTRYLLDTNIISALVRPLPPEPLVAWMAAQRDEDLCIAALTLAEIRRGILQMPLGRKREALDGWYDGPEGPPALFAGRILPFDAAAATAWARLMADGHAEGRPRSALDMIIAATALAHACVLATDNERDFAGVPMINPLRDVR